MGHGKTWSVVLTFGCTVVGFFVGKIAFVMLDSIAFGLHDGVWTQHMMLRYFSDASGVVVSLLSPLYFSLRRAMPLRWCWLGWSLGAMPFLYPYILFVGEVLFYEKPEVTVEWF